jgi:hypothetical protein
VVHHKDERRTVILTLRLTELEADMLAAAARRSGLSPSSLARARIFGQGDLEQRVSRLEETVAKLVTP